MSLSMDGAFNVVGALGEVILATAMIPQIYLAHKLNSTEYISYRWQVSEIRLLIETETRELCSLFIGTEKSILVLF